MIFTDTTRTDDGKNLIFVSYTALTDENNMVPVSNFPRGLAISI